MKILIPTLLIIFASFVNAQVYTKTAIINGLPSYDFYNKFRNTSQLYSYAELNDEQASISSVFLVRKMKDSTTSFYLIYTENENKIIVKNINTELRNISNHALFSLQHYGRNYSLEINKLLTDSVIFRYVFQKDSSSFIPTEFRTHLNLEIVTINKNYEEYSNSILKGSRNSEYSRLSANFLIGYGFGLRIFNKHEFVIRPAFAVYEKPFHGLELGLFYRYYLQENIFGYLGYIGHLGLEGAHGVSEHQDGSRGYFTNFGIGFNFIDELAVIINYSSVKHINAHGYKISYDKYDYLNYIKTRKQWDWLLSIGIEINY